MAKTGCNEMVGFRPTDSNLRVIKRETKKFNGNRTDALNNLIEQAQPSSKESSKSS